ncbi:hypothetical protein TURU_161250 [Turdus rufiventris]|nr:hypothetical protein TURU_161250 [Turdus rufiventris]
MLPFESAVGWRGLERPGASGCVLCGLTDDCTEKYGEKRTYVEYNLTVHYYCLLMSSGIWQRGEEDEGVDGFLITDIRKEVNRAARLVRMMSLEKEMRLGNLKKMHIKTYCIVINTVMLKDVSARKEEIIINLIALEENLYFEAGKMIAVSLVHGGPSPGFFSKTLFKCLVYGPENVKPALEDVADDDVAQTIKKIKYANSLSSLQSTLQDCCEFLAAAGCLRPVTALCDKNMLVNDILICHVIKRVTLPLERYPIGNRPLNCLELPITETYQQFKNKMEFTIRNTLGVERE